MDKDYFKNLMKNVDIEYDIAINARSKGFDPVDKVESLIASSLAEKSVGLISSIYSQFEGDVGKKISNRIIELEKEFGKLNIAVSFKIAEEISKEKYCKFSSLLESIDAGIRVGFAYLTLGVVSSPIEGFTGIKIKKRINGGEYLAAYFSGPIRSAGTTATCVLLMLIDYLRETFGYEKYDSTEDEIKRYIIENQDYHNRVTNLQYLPSDFEIEFLAKNIPIEINGSPTEEKEVSNFKDLPRVETNKIRGGMCLCFSEGLAQKAKKGWRLLSELKKNKFISSGWDFLDEYIKIQDNKKKENKIHGPLFLKDIVAGRPIFSYPSCSGGFRFRYGRNRTSGFSAVSIHPSSMIVLDGFLASGTQLKVEKPTKGSIVTSCSTIDGPIVKFKDGSVKKINGTIDENEVNNIEEIIYLGDILFPLSDVVNRNANLPFPGYVEEWWSEELKSASNNQENLDVYNVDLEKSVELSLKYNIPLHPSHIFYWTEISIDQFVSLINFLKFSSWDEGLILPYSDENFKEYADGKRALELLGVEHSIDNKKIFVKYGDSLLENFGTNKNSNFKEYFSEYLEKIDKNKSVLENINLFSRFLIKNKAGDFIGARMGRPEKAKLRDIRGNPNVLFPHDKNSLRDSNIIDKKNIISNFPIFFCENCNKELIHNICDSCGKNSRRMYFCNLCNSVKRNQDCDMHGKCSSLYTRSVNVEGIINHALNNYGVDKNNFSTKVLGVGNINGEYGDFENPTKGILRSKYNLSVNKDGTIRYDATEIPITHFKPIEIGASIEKLISLGYKKDIYGKELNSLNQILEIMPHDIILPSELKNSGDSADIAFSNVANFLDELIEKMYKMDRYYNIKTKDDLIGQLVVCMAPHNCAGAIGRIIGFSRMQGLLASPFMHAAMRRDCDGDEASIMLLLDVLLNFSRRFLPMHRGGTQDAPLMLNIKISAGEVDDQILDFEVGYNYPLSLYEAAEKREHSSLVKINNIKNILNSGDDAFSNIGFTHDTENINLGALNSTYKSLPTMKEKTLGELRLMDKIRAVDVSDAASLIIDRHLIRDIRGNLRKFFRQEFRCSSCNERFRRPPLIGKCTKCGGNLIFTISEGSIKKYLDLALYISNRYSLSSYTKQVLDMTKYYIDTIFNK